MPTASIPARQLRVRRRGGVDDHLSFAPRPAARRRGRSVGAFRPDWRQSVKTLFTKVLQNAKTGPIPVSITERASCWTGRALYGQGCYALYGALGHFWSGV